MPAGGLSYRHTEALLRKLGDATERLVLVGGQAVNFWAEFYASHSVELDSYAPYTSKDVDVAAKRADVAEFAARLGGEAHIAGFDDNAPQSGTIVYLDDDGEKHTLDVMANLVGVDSDELQRTSILLEYASDAGPAVRFRAMHPVLMIESRVSNVLGFEKYRTEHGLRQLRASVLCARYYLTDMAESDPRRTLTWNERIFRFRTHAKGKRIAAEHQVDVFEAVVCVAGLHEKFRTTRYPQMVEAVRRLRLAEGA